MKNCKRIFYVGAFSLCMMLPFHQSHAAARSNAAFDYLYRNPSLGRLTAGAYIGSMERDLQNGAFATTLSSDRMYAYLGYDLTRWANLYAVLGSNQSKLTGTASSDSATLYGAGLSLNLLNHFFREPTPMEDAFRINGDIRVISTSAEFFANTISWQEISASLRLSLLNFPDGDKRYRPESIAVYVGPAYSYISSSSVEAKDEFGAIGGLEVFFFDTMSIDLSVEYYGSASMFAGINFRF